jgi:hypothetical protein
MGNGSKVKEVAALQMQGSSQASPARFDFCDTRADGTKLPVEIDPCRHPGCAPSSEHVYSQVQEPETPRYKAVELPIHDVESD